MNKLLVGMAVATATVAVALTIVSNDQDVRPSNQTASEAPDVDAIPKTGESLPDASTSEPEKAADSGTELEVVHGLLVQKDRNCTVTVHYLSNEDGTVTEAYSCEPNTVEPEKPYRQYSNETLLAMVYHDAEAAETLGMRLRNEDTELALSLVVRASALANGDPRPIRTFSDAYPYSYATNGIPSHKTIQVRYVLSAVQEMLGSEDHGRGFWERKVRETAEDPETAIAQFDNEAHAIIAEMQAIQREVKGTINNPKG